MDAQLKAAEQIPRESDTQVKGDKKLQRHGGTRQWP
jgi:hypothetical protein